MRNLYCLHMVIALVLAGCVANTPAQDLTLDAVRACAPPAIKTKVRKLNPDGSVGFAWDPGAPETPRFFLACIRPYFATHALQGIAKPAPDASPAQRQGYADLDECLQRFRRGRLTASGKIEAVAHGPHHTSSRLAGDRPSDALS